MARLPIDPGLHRRLKALALLLGKTQTEVGHEAIKTFLDTHPLSPQISDLLSQEKRKAAEVA